MCKPMTCDTCTKPTWMGCGMHIDTAFPKDLPVEDRCACKARTQEEFNKKKAEEKAQ